MGMNRRRFLHGVLLGTAALLSTSRAVLARTTQLVRRLRIRTKPLNREDLYGPSDLAG